MRSQRGQVMIHVLVTAVITAVIAAGLVRMVLMRYQTEARVHESASNVANAQGSYMRVLSNWNAAPGRACRDVAGDGYTCAGGGCNQATYPSYCNCTMSPSSAADATIVVTDAGSGRCAITICTPPFSSCP